MVFPCIKVPHLIPLAFSEVFRYLSKIKLALADLISLILRSYDLELPLRVKTAILEVLTQTWLEYVSICHYTNCMTLHQRASRRKKLIKYKHCKKEKTHSAFLVDNRWTSSSKQISDIDGHTLTWQAQINVKTILHL